MKTPCLLAGLLGLILAAPLRAADAAPDGAREAWELLAGYKPEQALHAFRALTGGDPRRNQLGEAMALLAQPIPVPDRVARGRALLEQVAAGPDDDLALAARFYLGRVAEFQADPVDPRAAAQLFERLIAGHPASRWAQAAIARLAILQLYTAAGPAAPAARVDEAEKLVAAAREPQAIADLHLVIADAVFHYRLPDARALPHLLAAERTAVLDPTTRADVLVQIGELARLGGDRALAEKFYRTFLQEYPRDARQYPVKQQLAGLAHLSP
ncbi:MAG: tetratricopeptide repeat protein [Verrucomicrobia bacterium]|nr:tetratricopeptide repeat protein [Verrucomicrobiota bacterium]